MKFKFILIFSMLFISFHALVADDAASTDIIPVPTEQNLFLPYNSFSHPEKDADPLLALPIGAGIVTMGGDTVTLKVEAFPFSEAVDAYLGIHAPAINPNLFLVNKDNSLQPISQGLVKWKEGVTDISGDLFGDIPVANLPIGKYTFYLVVTPADYTGDFADIPYYYWTAVMNIRYKARDVADTAINNFGNEMDAAISILLATDKGYTLQQIVNAILANRISIDGDIIDGIGMTVTPDGEPHDLIINDISLTAADFKSKEQATITVKAEEEPVKLSELYTPEVLQGFVTFYIILAIDNGDFSFKDILNILLAIIADLDLLSEFIDKIEHYLTFNKLASELSVSSQFCTDSTQPAQVQMMSEEEDVICSLFEGSGPGAGMFSETQALNLAASNINTVYAGLGVSQDGAVDVVQVESFRFTSGYMAGNRFSFSETFVYDISTTTINVRGTTGYINDDWVITNVTVKESTVVEGWPSLNSYYSFTATDLPLASSGDGRYNAGTTGEATCAHIKELELYNTPYYINTEMDYYCDRSSYIKINFSKQ